jgi:hypothetical protein
MAKGSRLGFTSSCLGDGAGVLARHGLTAAAAVGELAGGWAPGVEAAQGDATGGMGGYVVSYLETGSSFETGEEVGASTILWGFRHPVNARN